MTTLTTLDPQVAPSMSKLTDHLANISTPELRSMFIDLWHVHALIHAAELEVEKHDDEEDWTVNREITSILLAMARSKSEAVRDRIEDISRGVEAK